jgi:hypothetical protein
LIAEDDLIFDISPIPEGSNSKYSHLYHWTSIDAALMILESKQIYGKDSGRHANFAIRPRVDLAKGSEVLLRFRFEGQHLALYGDTFESDKSPKKSANAVFHLFSEGNKEDWKTEEGRERLTYWQSNVYPGTTGLHFVGIVEFSKECEKLIQMNELKKPRWFAGNEARDKYKLQQNMLVLRQLAITRQGVLISVPYSKS